MKEWVRLGEREVVRERERGRGGLRGVAGAIFGLVGVVVGGNVLGGVDGVMRKAALVTYWERRTQ